jgi:predicted Fe-Mo cluster-binding NifX family protein
MKRIAVPTKSNNEIDEHFGHCEFYNIFTVSDEKQIIAVEKLDSPQGCGCKSNIAATLQENGVTVMLASGIGDGAVNKLSTHGIKVVRNCRGDVSSLINQYLAGFLVDGGSNCHAHEHGHECSH